MNKHVLINIGLLGVCSYQHYRTIQLDERIESLKLSANKKCTHKHADDSFREVIKGDDAMNGTTNQQYTYF